MKNRSTENLIKVYTILALYTVLVFSSCGKQADTPTLIDEDHPMVIADEISNHNIKAFAEDKFGHIWIATFRGLNKYDGNKYYQYFSTDDSLGIPDNNISDILVDHNKQLWVATVNGVCRYTDQNSFERIPMDDSNHNITQLLVSKENRVFIYNVSSLLEYDKNSNRFVKRIPNLDTKRNFLGQVCIDQNNNLWVINPQGLRCYSLVHGMKLIANIPAPANFYAFYTYLEKGHLLWLCCNNQLLLFDTQTRKFVNLPSSLANQSFVSHDLINSIQPYGEGKLLLTTSKYGNYLYDEHANKVISDKEAGFPFEEPNFKITKMFTDSHRNLWMGSSDQGYAVNYQYTKTFNDNNFLVSAIGHQSVLAFAADHHNNLFISTKMNGLYVYNTSSNELKHLPIQASSTSDGRDEIKALLVDKQENLWVANGAEVIKCRYNGGGLNIEKRYPAFYPMSLTEGDKGIVWCTNSSYTVIAYLPDGSVKEIPAYPATYVFTPSALQLSNGKVLTAAFNQELTAINPDNFNAEKLNINKEEHKKAITRSVFIPTDMKEDAHNNVYIGTVSNGLLKLQYNSGKISRIKGLSCSDVSALVFDQKKNLWVSTMNGLNMIDAQTGAITSYYASDGIGGNQFNDRAALLLPNDKLIFGGTHGLTIFNPGKVKVRENIPLVFETLKIHNEVITPSGSNSIRQSLENKPTIRLAHDQNSFGVSFAILAYGDGERANYSYMLENYSSDWVDVGSNHEAYFANLPAGHYTLKVKAQSKGNSYFKAENEIEIIVSPAPWNSWWAWLLYLVLAAAIVYQLYLVRKRISHEKEVARQAELEKEQEKRVNKMNMSFFANISHEFRTPLTMISGPVGMLCDDASISEQNRKLLLIIQRSVARMLKLVNQLMDFNKLENDTLKLKVRRTDVINTIQRTCDIFRVNAEEKGIEMRLHGLEDTFLTWLDTDKLEKILNNLLSNAMKFTPKDGRIDVTFDADKEKMKISVADTGKGIPEDQQEKIFRRYYQLDNQTKGKYNWGTDIGLYYAKRLAELHHGDLSVANREDVESGAIFTLTLPVGENIYTASEKALPEDRQEEMYPIPSTSSANKEEEIDTTDKPTILVVDDDTEVVNYLQTLLMPYYHVVYRFDAESAYKAINEDEPNLILSDVIMPGKNGYELCREIKENLQICHIPVILVTAKATVENQVEGLNTGADAYITKPFDPKLLLAMINSLLQNRAKVRKLLSESTQTDEIDDKSLSPQDKQFMNQLYQIMEDELSNNELDVMKLTEMLHISRTKLYYKMKGLTGTNPSIFFKTYKLNRAAELIKEGKYTMGEVADMTGFNTPSHFSTSFKKQFGVSPSEFV